MLSKSGRFIHGRRIAMHSVVIIHITVHGSGMRISCAGRFDKSNSPLIE